MAELFLYSVNPRKAITGLSEVKVIRTPKSVLLTKEDVLTCLQKATVYRRFAAEGINERVTIGNVDRLHRADYVSEEDWGKVVTKEMSEGHGKVVAPSNAESKQETAADEVVELTSTVEEKDASVEVAEPVKEEVVEKESVVEDTVSEEAATEEEVVLSDDEDWTETDTENDVDKEESAETSDSQDQKKVNQQFTYNKKK